MSKVYLFSRAQLEKLKVEHLINLANFYQVKINKTSTKEEIIASILENQAKAVFYDTSLFEEEKKFSVRVKRIMDSMNKEN